ncbi:hypothetical protein D1818_10515 [Aquimarina sp. BL5]|uniref:hypothetical protein n=1 Tax=Aquimarina sp. BL5 TaxID=1714860 RepID=UPI000E493E42|nr:hypothetical protein [Aquimarina sp. BL5]AXT51237.1 hypothetical protein D1818_10515 [Aquimarina sp. BL5]RKN06243.1 hypothetical protein D7036_09320 [Aquimarina sp. BL5]
MFKDIIVLFLLVLLSSCNITTQKENVEDKNKGWQVIYSNDNEGNALSGDIDNLKKAVRQGCEIRVGWGQYSEYKKDGLTGVFAVEHTADAQFLTINKGHVYAQLSRIMGQAPSRERHHINLVKTHYWQSVLGTTGEMTQVYLDHSDVNKSDDYSDNVKVIWYVNRNDCNYEKNDNQVLY